MKKTGNQSNLLLFTNAEKVAKDFALNNVTHPFDWHKKVAGLISESDVSKELKKLKSLAVDDYIARVLDPAEAGSRPSAKTIVRKLKGKIYNEVDQGPLYGP